MCKGRTNNATVKNKNRVGAWLWLGVGWTTAEGCAFPQTPAKSYAADQRRSRRNPELDHSWTTIFKVALQVGCPPRPSNKRTSFKTVGTGFDTWSCVDVNAH